MVMNSDSDQMIRIRIHDDGVNTPSSSQYHHRLQYNHHCHPLKPFLYLSCMEKALSSGQPATHKLIVSGREPTPVELFSGHLSNRDDLRTTHEQADVTMVYQVLKIAQSNAQSIKVISDETDVFVLLMHFCSEQKLCCRLIMKATSS